MCNNSRLFMFIINNEREQISSYYKKLIMKTYWVYLLCVSIVGVQGFLTIRDFKIDAVTKGTEATKSLSTSLSSYSEYLQSLN